MPSDDSTNQAHMADPDTCPECGGEKIAEADADEWCLECIHEGRV